MTKFNYSVATIITKDGAPDWVVKFFNFVGIGLPKTGSKVCIYCYNEEFLFLIDNKSVWSGSIPYQLECIDALVRAGRLPKTELETAKHSLLNKIEKKDSTVLY